MKCGVACVPSIGIAARLANFLRVLAQDAMARAAKRHVLQNMAGDHRALTRSATGVAMSVATESDSATPNKSSGIIK